MTTESEPYDVIIVGAGLAGAILAKELGKRKLRVLILEAGAPIPNGREAFMEKFYLDTGKLPESPFPQQRYAPAATVRDLIPRLVGDPADPTRTYLDQSSSKDVSNGRRPFGSTYERRAGGTMWHWMGTSLRFVPKDFDMPRYYGRGVSWPITYQELALEPRSEHGGMSYYDAAEHEIGVAGSVKDQTADAKRLLTVDSDRLYREGYEYPMPPIALSTVDQFFVNGLSECSKKGRLLFDDYPVWHYSTPAGRNSRPYKNRRACAGNTNCVPICPIQAKYDSTVTLHAAFNELTVTARFQCVATRLLVDTMTNQIEGVEFLEYDDDSGERLPRPTQVVRGKVVVLAAHGIEIPKLLFLSGDGNSHFKNPHIGRYLMDHPFYIRHGLAPLPVYPFRGPLSTGGLDGLRDGDFRRERAAFRIEIGNDGWRLPTGDPDASVVELVDKNVFGTELVRQLNDRLTRQIRIGFELDQLPRWGNRVSLSTHRDPLGLRKPKIDYSISDYEAAGLAAAHRLTKQLFAHLDIEDRSPDKDRPDDQLLNQASYSFLGAGHVMGTCRMGKSKDDSVVNKWQQSHDYSNLFIVGSAVFPTGGTANPSLTIAALSLWAADNIDKYVHGKDIA